MAKTKETIRVLYASPEATPFSGTGGLGEVAGTLPAALNQRRSVHMDCRLITPLYGSVPDVYRKKMQFLGSMEIPVAWRSKYMGVFLLVHKGVKCYFIDNEEYFRRDALYGYYDDCERFAFFSRAVHEAIAFMDGFVPDVIHANDWQTALVPVYQDAVYQRPFTTTVFTIHNVEYQGHYGREVIDDVVGLPGGAEHLLEYHGGCNLMKGGIDTANLVTTVSPTYAQELQDPFFAYGMDPIIRKLSVKMRGILNGLDTVLYNPSRDSHIAATYSAEDLSGKQICKEALQKEMGLPVRPVPLLTVVTRFVTAKGMDLLCQVLDNLLQEQDIQLVVLGSGDIGYEDFFRGLAERHPGRTAVTIGFDRALSHRIYAGGDIFLMPSRSEPCGLAQMIGCRYGDIPIVRSTGGLADSIADCTFGEGNGFRFDAYDPEALREAILRALALYQRPDDWEALVRHDLTLDFGWSKAAQEYVKLYREVKFH